MKYYIHTIEQYKQDDTYVELGKEQNANTYDSALGKFYDLLSTVAKSAAHNYLDIKIIKSDGGIIKKDVYGEYIDPDKIEKPVETPSEEPAGGEA